MAPTTWPAISQDEIKCLGIEASPSFVREPEGNGVAERFHTNTERESTVGEDLRDNRTAARRTCRLRQALTMKPGSSRGMDTRRQHKSEQRQTTPQPAIDQPIDQALSLAA